MYSTKGASAAYTAGAGAMYLSTGAGAASTAGAGVMYSTKGASAAKKLVPARCTCPLVLAPRARQERACCAPPQVHVRRKLLVLARCTCPLVLAPRTRLEQARRTHPLVLAQRTRQELARCTPPQVQVPRSRLLGPARTRRRRAAAASPAARAPTVPLAALPRWACHRPRRVQKYSAGPTLAVFCAHRPSCVSSSPPQLW